MDFGRRTRQPLREPLDLGYTFRIPVPLKFVNVGTGAALVTELLVVRDELDVNMLDADEIDVEEHAGLTVAVVVMPIVCVDVTLCVLITFCVEVIVAWSQSVSHFYSSIRSRP